MIVLEVQRFPLQKPTIGALARAGGWAVEDEAGVAKTGCKLVQVARMSGPADKARLRKFLQTKSIRYSGLLRIGSNNLEVAARAQFISTGLAEREEGVARAASGMNAAECGANAGVFFDEGDAAIEIAAAEEHVIEHGGRPFFREREFGSQRETGCGC